MIQMKIIKGFRKANQGKTGGTAAMYRYHGRLGLPSLKDAASILILALFVALFAL